MKYRSRTDIIEIILNAAINGGTKTRLMYASYLSYAQIVEYIEFLTQRELIQLGPNKEYRLTQKGLQFLRAYEEISAIVSLDGAKTTERFRPAVAGWIAQ
jgi:predicted transcriptional regulator